MAMPLLQVITNTYLSLFLCRNDAMQLSKCVAIEI